MEQILDALRRIISRWVETVTPITSDVSPGDTLINVNSAKRFSPGDEVMIESPLEGEPNLIIDEIVSETQVRLATPVLNAWDIDSNITLRKLVNGMFVEGIYIGDVNVVPMFPAITINGTSVTSEWMTLDSTKERYEVELTVYVEQITKEQGYRFVMRMVEEITKALKANIFPLVNDFDMTTVTGDISRNDEVIRVADSSIFNTHLTDTTGGYPRKSDARAIIEDRWKSEETRVQEILSPTEVTIRPFACQDFAVADNAIIICPHRFIYNSWPHHRDIGTTAKDGTLLQTGVVRWFAEEEQVVDFRNNDPHLK